MAKKKTEEEKKHTFSIWLLKKTIEPEMMAKTDIEINPISLDVPARSIAFFWKRKPEEKRMWWQEYWNIPGTVIPDFSNAIIFIPIRERWFAIIHGHTETFIKDEFIETRFAYKVVLNALDPGKLSTTKTFQPDNSIRQLTQKSSGEGTIYLPQFGITSTSILRDLAGRVLPKYTSLFSSVSGGSGKAPKMQAQTFPKDFQNVLQNLLTLSESMDYKQAFPEISHIDMIDDTEEICRLDKILESKWSNNTLDIQIDFPDIIDTFEWVWEIPPILPKLHPINEFNIETILEAVKNANKQYSFEKLCKLRVIVKDTEDATYKKSYSLYSCISFDTTVSCEPDQHYYLIGGIWYKADTKFISNLDEELRNKLVDKLPEETFPPIDDTNSALGSPNKSNDEEEYNIKLAKALNGILLDRTNIAPDGQTAVEPCDVLLIEDQSIWLIHSKIFRGSPCLSHLFNQGYVSAQLIKQITDSREKFVALIKGKNKDIEENQGFTNFLEDKIPLSVLFCIIQKHDRKQPLSIEHLPLFAKISLKHILEAFNSLKIDVGLSFVTSIRVTGISKNQIV